MREVSTARTAAELLETGQMRFSVDHAPLVGITSAMLAWWFDNLVGTVVVDGVPKERFIAWHPADHQEVMYLAPGPDGRNAGVGAQLRFREVLRGNPRYRVDARVVVEHLDHRGFVYGEWVGGRRVMRTELAFTDTEEGVVVQSLLRIGVGEMPMHRPFNRLVLPFLFPEAMGMAWMVHHVEEMGNLEAFLADLFRSETG